MHNIPNGATILVVDDNPQNLAVLFGHLERFATVLVARSGKDALDILEETAPDVILLDILMPEMSGYETCARIKQDPRRRDIPVIFVSSLSETVDKVKGFELGGVDYITKPFQLEEVVSRVAAHVRLRQIQAELTRSNERLHAEIALRTKVEAFLLEKQAQLEAAHEQFVSVLQSLEAGVCVLSLDANELLLANRYFDKALGPDSLRRMDHAPVASLLDAHGSPAGPQATEWRNPADGRWFFRQERAVYWVDKTLVRLVLLLDITSRKDLERLKEDVERIMRHDLKTPLAGIVSLPQVFIHDANLLPEQRQYLQLIIDSGQRMLNMIELSLVMFQIEQNTYVCQHRPFDLLHILRQVQAGVNSIATGKHAELRTQLIGVPDAPQAQLFARGESLLTYSLLSNLLKNAIEAAPEGSAVEVVLESGADILLEIRNQGVVPISIRDRFFGKYVTADKPKGTGLGAYSAKLLAEAMGYGLRMETSDEENSTQLVLRIPKFTFPTDGQDSADEAFAS